MKRLKESGGSKLCGSCRQMLPLDQFGQLKTSPSGLRHDCKPCRNAIQQRYVDSHREIVYAKNKAWRDAGGRERSKLQKYGLTLADYDRMLSDQDHGCAICGLPCKSGRKLAVDHCHDTGVVRGLLCSRCNAGIALFAHRPDLLRAAIAYLSRTAQSAPPPPP